MLNLKQLPFTSKPDAFPWKAYTVCNAHGKSTLEDDIGHFLTDPNLADAMTNLLALVESVLSHISGPQAIQNNGNLCHEAVAGTGIYEFVKRPLRLYWFYGEDRRVIIIPTVHHKKQQTTPKSTEKHLRRTLKAYRAAHKQRALNYL